MDDKVTPPTDTAEYKFIESEVAIDNTATTELPPSAETTTSVDSPRPAFKISFKNIDFKRLARPGLIVLGILTLYFGFSIYSSKKTQNAEQQKAKMQENAALVQQSAIVSAPQTSTLTSAPANLGVGVSNDQVAQIQNAVQQKIDAVAQQISNGQDRMSSVNESITKTRQDVADINQRLDLLTTATQQVLLEIEKIRTPPKAVKKKEVKLPVAYHIRAIVPERVWLESEDGQSVTLRVGDKLEGYGEVRVIAPRQGMIVMSNGSIIQYGANDF